MSHCLSWTLLWLLATHSATWLAHDGPDPLVHWQFNQTQIKNNQLKALLGPDGIFNSAPKIVTDPLGQSVRFHGRGMECVVAKDFQTIREYLPDRDFTLSAWVAVEEPTEFGGIVGTFQDNGGYEKGWVVGYDQDAHFTFALSSEGADDGDGLMTYLTGKTPFEPGRMYHVVAIYDGTTMQLFVNGKLDASTNEQSGKILYPEQATTVIGSYRDRNEFHPMKGRIREMAVYDIAAKPEWVSQEFEHRSDVARLPQRLPSGTADFVVQPYLQYGTKDAMTVCWRSGRAAPGTLHWGESIRCEHSIAASEPEEIQQVRITELEPETQYFYWVESENGEGTTIESEVSTFQTAGHRETPFAFAVISDTQHNPAVSGPLAKLAWSHRPNFLLHAGDLVDKGKMSDDWIDEFFASMHPLISRVPLFPVLGNHEQDARHYYDYMALPDPEYHYQFSYGNADFFMIDSNRKVDPGSEQYQWLDQELAASDATWKFVCHHHPPYSSDENDYGNLWKNNRSTRGDLRVRELVPLYEKHNVDVVWTGHIHSYERTWPLRDNRAVEVNGTIYMVTGGGGGGLETPGPYRPFFQNNVRRCHHYLIVAINGNTLQLKAFSLDDELFDTVTIYKH